MRCIRVYDVTILITDDWRYVSTYRCYTHNVSIQRTPPTLFINSSTSNSVRLCYSIIPREFNQQNRALANFRRSGNKIKTNSPETYQHGQTGRAIWLGLRTEATYIFQTNVRYFCNDAILPRFISPINRNIAFFNTCFTSLRLRVISDDVTLRLIREIFFIRWVNR